MKPLFLLSLLPLLTSATPAAGPNPLPNPVAAPQASPIPTYVEPRCALKNSTAKCYSCPCNDCLEVSPVRRSATLIFGCWIGGAKKTTGEEYWHWMPEYQCWIKEADITDNCWVLGHQCE
ncbi:hypothetical protein EX30DRAFT_342799 [Ascodesmis nigricans]|uniref:Uncharacterized protein n=1 Tax=Ascodesmis nigricans TaxID=341454 RepID=A0A4S2MRU3_9PEZI|nr:hypothetical protein EX30DRAFT_342799 [Ascodesmis nigricans]